MFIAMFFIATESYSQSGWSASNYYANRGDVWTECGQTYPKYNFDQWGRSYYIGMYKTCKTTVWHRQYRAGNIYLWSHGRWHYEWRDGHSWYYTWRIYEVFVRR